MDFRRIVEIDPARCFRGLLKKMPYIILFTILGAVAGVLIAIFAVSGDNVYTGSASVYSIAYGSMNDTEEGVTALRTYSEIIKSYKVSERAVLLLGDNSLTKEDVYDMIDVDSNVVTGTTYVYEQTSYVIKIHASSTDPEKSINVVNAVADAFVLEANSIGNNDSVQVLDYAENTEITYSAIKERALVIGLGAAAGFFLSVFTVLFLIVFSKKIVSVRDASLYGQMNIIGFVPKF